VNISAEVSAAIPEAFLTAFQLLFWYGKPERIGLSEEKNEEKNEKGNDVVLIHAGASGVGTTLVQYCREFGLNAFVTASTQQKIDFCVGLGAKGGANYKTENFDEKLLTAFDGGADIVLDCVGASHWHRNLNAIALDGRLVSYGFLSGAKVQPLDANDPTFSLVPILKKRISIIGTTLRKRSNEYKARLVADFKEKIVEPLIATEKIAPIISKVFPMAEAQKAHEFVAANKNIGKVVLTWNKEQCTV